MTLKNWPYPMMKRTGKIDILARVEKSADLLRRLSFADSIKYGRPINWSFIIQVAGRPNGDYVIEWKEGPGKPEGNVNIGDPVPMVNYMKDGKKMELFSMIRVPGAIDEGFNSMTNRRNWKPVEYFFEREV